MGYGHDLNHRDVLDTIERCIRKIADSGNIAGTYVGTPERAAEAISWGANYLVTAITPHMVNGAKHYLQIKITNLPSLPYNIIWLRKSELESAV